MKKLLGILGVLLVLLALVSPGVAAEEGTADWEIEKEVPSALTLALKSEGAIERLATEGSERDFAAFSVMAIPGVSYGEVRVVLREEPGVGLQKLALSAMTSKGEWVQIGSSLMPMPLGDSTKEVVFLEEEYLHATSKGKLTFLLSADIAGKEGRVTYTLALRAVDPFGHDILVSPLEGELQVVPPVLEAGTLDIYSTGTTLENGDFGVVHRFSAGSSIGEVIIGDIRGVVEAQGSVEIREFRLVHEGPGDEQGGFGIISALAMPAEFGEFAFTNLALQTAEIERFSIEGRFVGEGSVRVRVTEMRARNVVTGEEIEVVGLPLAGPAWEIQPRNWEIASDGGLALALEQALPSDTISLGKGRFKLPQPPLDTARNITLDGPGVSGTTLLGQLRFGEGAVLRGFGLVNNRAHEREAPGFAYTDAAAIRTQGPATFWGVVVSGTNPWVVMGSSADSSAPASIVAENNIFIGRMPLTLDVFHPVELARPAVRGNIFVGQSCAIDVSIDVVFQDIPTRAGRLAAYEQYAAALEAANIFRGVDRPVCGSFG